MPYTSPATVVTATTITSTWGNSVKAATDYLANPPACRVYNSGNISVPNNIETVLTFDSERWDTNSMHSTSSLTSRITFNTAGLYLVWGGVSFVGAADYSRIYGAIKLNGITYLALEDMEPNATTNTKYFTVDTIYKFAVGDYIEVYVSQVNGAAAARNASANPNRSLEFSATWIGLG